MVFKNIVLLLAVPVVTSACALWPYKKDFDCPVQEGLKCKSLYEISQMADQGLFGPHANKEEIKICPCNKQRIRKVKVKELEDLGCRCYAS